MPICIFFAALAIAIAEDIFSESLPSSSLNDLSLFETTPEPLFGDELNGSGTSDLITDTNSPSSPEVDWSSSSSPFMAVVADSDPPKDELELASCSSSAIELSDALSRRKVQAREMCQPLPLQGQLPDWLTDLGNKFKKKFGFQNDDDPDGTLFQWQENSLIDRKKCYPPYIYNLCCLNQNSLLVRIFMGQEVTRYYENCNPSKCKRLSLACLWTQKFLQTRLTDLPTPIASGPRCEQFDVCCRGAEYFTTYSLTGVECYQLSRPLPIIPANPPAWDP